MNCNIVRLSKLKDKSNIMSLLLSKSCSSLNNSKNIIQYPLILISSALVVVNSYFKEEQRIKTVNICLNASNIFLMAVLNNLKIVEKIENHKVNSQAFLELAHLIDSCINMGDTDTERTTQLQKDYDMLMKYTLTDAISESVKKKVRNEYEDYDLPLLLGKISPPPS